MKTYKEQLREQIEQYRNTENMQDLPAVFYLWSSNYIGPGVRQVFSVDNVNQFYVEAFVAAAQHNSGVPAFLSLGCGDGAVEIGIARTLRERGMSPFRFVCYDLSDILLSRFRSSIPSDLSGCFEIATGDLNASAFGSQFDAIMANHSLHHMVDLERIFSVTWDSLSESGIFVTADMIGRNGHMRWPEARLFVDFFWPFLTIQQRVNGALERLEATFADHDCSTVGCEGIRSQDVLPAILTQGFKPWKFLGVGGLIDVFVDRGFGPNFDRNNPDDAFLIQRIALLNEILLDTGLLKPTMMFAWFVKREVEEVCYRRRSAGSAVRNPGEDPHWLANAGGDLGRLPLDRKYAFKAQVLLPAGADASASKRAAAPTQADGATSSMNCLLAALRHAQDETAAVRAAAALQAARLQAIENSTSWHITAPLRALASKLFTRTGR